MYEKETDRVQAYLDGKMSRRELLGGMSALVLGVPAAYAFARFRFRLGEDIAFTLLSFRFAPPLLVLLPLYAQRYLVEGLSHGDNLA